MCSVYLAAQRTSPHLLESDYPAKVACLSNASDLDPHTILPARECYVFQTVDMQDRDSLCETHRLRGDKFLNSHGDQSYFCCIGAVGSPPIWRSHQALPSMCLMSRQAAQVRHDRVNVTASGCSDNGDLRIAKYGFQCCSTPGQKDA